MQLPIFIRHQIRKLRDWQVERDAVRHLREMNDHILRDIGIERQDIETVVHGLMTERIDEEAHRRWLRQDAEDRLRMVPAE